MLRANVGLSRKISRDYQSTGYTVTVEGDIPASPDQPDEILKHIHRLFRLAEDSLSKEIDRDQGEQAIGRHDEERPEQSRDDRNGDGPSTDRGRPPQPNGSPRPQNNGQPEPATNKQVQYMLSLAKRQGLSKVQLEDRIAEILGQRLTVYQVSKKEAGQIIETLNQQEPANGRR